MSNPNQQPPGNQLPKPHDLTDEQIALQTARALLTRASSFLRSAHDALALNPKGPDLKALGRIAVLYQRTFDLVNEIDAEQRRTLDME